MSLTGSWYPEWFVWWFLGWLGVAVVAILLIWGVSELAAWGIGKLRGGKAKTTTLDPEEDAVIDLWADAYHNSTKAA